MANETISNAPASDATPASPISPAGRVRTVRETNSERAQDAPSSDRAPDKALKAIEARGEAYDESALDARAAYAAQKGRLKRETFAEEVGRRSEELVVPTKELRQDQEYRVALQANAPDIRERAQGVYSAEQERIRDQLEVMRAPVTPYTSAQSRQWAEVDARDYRRIKDPQQEYDAALRIGDNLRQDREYRAALKANAPEIGERAQAVYSAEQVRIEAKDARKRTDLERLPEQGVRMRIEAENTAGTPAPSASANSMGPAAPPRERAASVKNEPLRTPAQESQALPTTERVAPASAGDQNQDEQHPRKKPLARVTDERETDRRAELADKARRALEERYIHEGKEFRFRDAPERVAFREEAKKLTTQYESAEVVRGMLDAAQANGWKGVAVSGSEEFRRKAWLEAQQRELYVRGFEPSERDRIELQRLVDLREARTASPRTAASKDNAAPTARAHDDAVKMGGSPKAEVVPRQPEQGVRMLIQAHQMVLSAAYADDQSRANREIKTADQIELQAYRHLAGLDLPVAQALLAKALLTEREELRTGVRLDEAKHRDAREVAAVEGRDPKAIGERILELGAANYKFNPEEAKSYYIKLRDVNGKERTVWGKDLERAANEAHVEVGDAVRLRIADKQQVTVESNVRDEENRVVGREAKGAHRNRWEIEKVDSERQAVHSVAASVLDRQGVGQTLRTQVHAEIDKQLADRPTPDLRVYDRSAPRSIERPAHQVDPSRSRELPTRS